MQSVLTFLLLLLTSLGLAQRPSSPKTSNPSDARILLTPSQWRFQAGKVDFIDYKGQKAMRLAKNGGLVSINDLFFQDGTIEFDLEPIRPESANSIYFHRQDDNEQEIVYLRTNYTANPLSRYGIQYCPYLGGVNLWDLYPDYQAPALLKPDTWNHLKLIISGRRLQVYLNQAPQPVLDIPQLEARPLTGRIAFEGAAYLANVQIKPGVVEELSPHPAPDLTRHDPNYLRHWATTTPQELPLDQELSVRQLPAPDQFRDSLMAERGGLLNLSRKYGTDAKRRVIWLQTTLFAQAAVRTPLQLGFSDEVWVFLNRQPVLVDKNLFQYNLRKYPDGRISIQNTRAVLNLVPGENDLLIGVANDFYGWGLMARLESTDQLASTGQLDPIFSLPRELARLDLSAYEGTYRNAEIGFTLRFSQKDKVLQVQFSDQPPLALQAVGHHTFVYGLASAAFAFDLARQKVIFREGGETKECTKQ